MERATVALVVIGMLGAVALPAWAGTGDGTVSEQYLGVGEFVRECGSPIDVPGSACFAVPDGADNVTIQGIDMVSEDVVLWINYWDDAEDAGTFLLHDPPLDDEFVCNERTRDLPVGTELVGVTVQSPGPALIGLVPDACLDDAPTTGVIEAEFRDTSP